MSRHLAGVNDLLEHYQDAFARLNVATRNGHASPHKPCMLLAVIDLADAGALDENSIPYLPPLIDRYRAYFAAVATERDHANSYFPYFHLRSEGFWHLHPKRGRSAVLEAMTTARSHGDIINNIAYVTLDPALHALLQQPTARERLADQLISRWFPQTRDGVLQVRAQHLAEAKSERELRDSEAPTPGGVAEELRRPPRESAFRRIVLEAYDYRCAASGIRLIVPDGPSLVDAAHIKPFAKSYDDRPVNGIALAPTYHRAFDLNLIAFDLKMRWRVAPIFDERIPDHREILKLDGKPVIGPHVDRYRPDAEVVQWRLEQLRGGEVGVELR
jgi:putative restriction endonuclease